MLDAVLERISESGVLRSVHFDLIAKTVDSLVDIVAELGTSLEATDEISSATTNCHLSSDKDGKSEDQDASSCKKSKQH